MSDRRLCAAPPIGVGTRNFDLRYIVSRKVIDREVKQVTTIAYGYAESWLLLVYLAKFVLGVIVFSRNTLSKRMCLISGRHGSEKKWFKILYILFIASWA